MVCQAKRGKKKNQGMASERDPAVNLLNTVPALAFFLVVQCRSLSQDMFFKVCGQEQ